MYFSKVFLKSFSRGVFPILDGDEGRDIFARGGHALVNWV